jgi:ribosome-interacting GTPase 1
MNTHTHISQAEYAKTQKNKATEGHLGLVKAKIAKLKREILEGGDGKGGGGGGGGRGFDVQKSGDTRVACIGFPSVGKCVQLHLHNSLPFALYARENYQQNDVLMMPYMLMDICMNRQVNTDE